MTRYRLAIFDFDGTLADSLDWFRASFQEAIARFDLAPVSPKELEGMRGLSAREIMARLKVSMWQLPAIVNDMRKRKLAAAGAIQGPNPDYRAIREIEKLTRITLFH